MPTVEVSRTLVKSPPELWTELKGDCISKAVGAATVRPTEDERALEWEAEGAHGTARLEPAGWGTKVTLTAEVEDRVAQFGFWSRRHEDEPPGAHPDLEQKLSELLDDLGGAHKKPFTAE